MLREDNFAKAWSALGYTSDAAMALHLGLSERTIKRARQGDVGHLLISRSLKSFRARPRKLARVGLKPTFETFFEVR